MYILHVHVIFPLLGDVSLVDVTAPQVLVTSSSVFIQWSYPELIERLIRDDNPNLVENVVIRYRASGQVETKTVNASYPTNSTNVTGLSPETTHDFIINVKYNGLDGTEIMIVVPTRREGRCGLPIHVHKCTCVLYMFSIISFVFLSF